MRAIESKGDPGEEIASLTGPLRRHTKIGAKCCINYCILVGQEGEFARALQDAGWQLEDLVVWSRSKGY